MAHRTNAPEQAHIAEPARQGSRATRDLEVGFRAPSKPAGRWEIRWTSRGGHIVPLMQMPVDLSCLAPDPREKIVPDQSIALVTLPKKVKGDSCWGGRFCICHCQFSSSAIVRRQQQGAGWRRQGEARAHNYSIIS